MRKFPIFLACVALLGTQTLFADMTMMSGMNGKEMSGRDFVPSKQCAMIAKACKQAGYERQGAPGKDFWHDCMKPVLMGQTVTDVNVDQKVVDKCKKDKIKDLKMDLKDLQQTISSKMSS